MSKINNRPTSLTAITVSCSARKNMLIFSKFRANLDILPHLDFLQISYDYGQKTIPAQIVRANEITQHIISHNELH